MDFLDEYKALTEKLLFNDSREPRTDAESDSMFETLDRLWSAMSEAQHAELEAWIKDKTPS